MRWQPIETVPDSGEFLVSDGQRIERVNRSFTPCTDDGAACSWGAGDFESETLTLSFVPTHWMPLPLPPQ